MAPAAEDSASIALLRRSVCSGPGNQPKEWTLVMLEYKNITFNIYYNFESFGAFAEIFAIVENYVAWDGPKGRGVLVRSEALL